MPLSLRIAYLWSDTGTSLQRAKALERLGHSVTLVEPTSYLPLRSKWMWRWFDRTGGMGVQRFMVGPTLAAVKKIEPDLIWVDQGSYLGKDLIKQLRFLGAPIINYTIDDPFGGRDRKRFYQYTKALPYYDLLAVVREENIAEAKAHGLSNVIRVWRSADEIAHRPREVEPDDISRWGSDVCFIGTWMPERGPFMAALIRAGIPLSIFGNKWNQAPEWPLLAPYWRGPGESDPDIYAYIIQTAKICLGLVSRGNRDRHTTRSLEIPALGALLCAERTDEHLALYQDGEEAVFWSDSEECIAKCKMLLADASLARNIRKRGYRRCLENNLFNEPVMNDILHHRALNDSLAGKRFNHISSAALI